MPPSVDKLLMYSQPYIQQDEQKLCTTMHISHSYTEQIEVH